MQNGHSQGYIANDKIWFLDEGNRLITGVKTIYAHDASEGYDLSYKGNINLANSELINLDYSKNQQRVCLIAMIEDFYKGYAEYSSIICIHSFDYLSRLKTMEIPHFPISKTSNEYNYVKAFARYCYFNRNGNKIVTLLNTNQNPHNASEGKWGIYVTKY